MKNNHGYETKLVDLRMLRGSLKNYSHISKSQLKAMVAKEFGD